MQFGALKDSRVLPDVRNQSGVIRRDKLRLAVRGRSPDQFRLSRLKEGERVCGGRGQFGKQPLWNFNSFRSFGWRAEALRSADAVRSERVPELDVLK
jgi:hypothetical protein